MAQDRRPGGYPQSQKSHRATYPHFMGTWHALATEPQMQSGHSVSECFGGTVRFKGNATMENVKERVPASAAFNTQYRQPVQINRVLTTEHLWNIQRL